MKYCHSLPQVCEEKKKTDMCNITASKGADGFRDISEKHRQAK